MGKNGVRYTTLENFTSDTLKKKPNKMIFTHYMIKKYINTSVNISLRIFHISLQDFCLKSWSLFLEWASDGSLWITAKEWKEGDGRSESRL